MHARASTYARADARVRTNHTCACAHSRKHRVPSTQTNNRACADEQERTHKCMHARPPTHKSASANDHVRKLTLARMCTRPLFPAPYAHTSCIALVGQ
eukprot:607730-Pleurochrysis_carterae.AAC.1